MTAENFCYWLQGKLEIDGERTQMLTVEQVEVIRRHLQLVFTKATAAPPATPPRTAFPWGTAGFTVDPRDDIEMC